MKRAFKLAVVMGGISALAWGMRKRFRIAIGKGDDSEPDFHIIEPDQETTKGEMPAEEEQDIDSNSSPESDRDDSEPDNDSEPDTRDGSH